MIIPIWPLDVTQIGITNPGQIIMVMKEYFTFPKASEQEPHHQIV